MELEAKIPPVLRNCQVRDRDCSQFGHWQTNYALWHGAAMRFGVLQPKESMSWPRRMPSWFLSRRGVRDTWSCIQRRRNMLFTDRQDAGRQLAERLLTLKEKKPVVLALPRGGVPVGFEVASALKAPLDLVLVRKISAPFDEELAVGAITDGEDPELVIDAELAADLNISPEYFKEAKAKAQREIERRRRIYLGDRQPVNVAGCTAIVLDDGVATGSTMLAAVRMIRRRNPARIVLVVPVAPEHALERLRREVDETVCLHMRTFFDAVGQFYTRFPQLCDQEVTALLDRARAFAPATNPGVVLNLNSP
jgi:putative phosphoribosyl transferase